VEDGMQSLSERHGFPIVERGLRFLAIRLKSRPETKDLAGEVEALRQRLRERDDIWAQAQEVRVAASAEVAYVDTLLGDGVISLAREIAFTANGDYSDPRYQKLFPTTPSVAMAGVAGDTQTRYVKTILSFLKQDDELKPWRARAKTLDEQLKQLEAAVAKRDELYIPEAKALAERRQVLDEAKRVYNLMHPRLRLLFPRDKALVESFFARLSAVRDPAEDETAAEPVAPTEPSESTEA
jgi:hypothetical protein